MALSISRALAAEKAFNMVVPSGNEEDGLTIPEVELMIDEAAREVCDQTVTSEKIYRLHDPNISVPVVSGVGTIPVTVYAESIPESRKGRVTFARTDVAEQPIGDIYQMKDLSALRRPRPGGTDLVAFAVRGSGGGGTIYVYDADANPCSGTATILAARIYTFETMPAELEKDFLTTLAMMATERLKNKGTINGGNDQTAG